MCTNGYFSSIASVYSVGDLVLDAVGFGHVLVDHLRVDEAFLALPSLGRLSERVYYLQT